MVNGSDAALVVATIFFAAILHTSSKGLHNSSLHILELQGEANGAQHRVPDIMVKVGDDLKAIGEVKDTAKLANTRQLTDLMGAAKDSGAKFSLYLGEKTQMTKPLATQLYNSGASVYRSTGGKFVDITKTLKPTQ